MNDHVAIFPFPLPALVHLTFAIVATLIRRGHRVTFVTSDRVAAEATALGTEVLRCSRLDYPFNQDDDAAMPMERQYVRDPISLAYRTFSVAWPFYQINRPDRIIYDSQSIAGRGITDDPCAMERKATERRAASNELLASYDSQRINAIRGSREATFYLYLRELQLSAQAREGDVFYAARCTTERASSSQRLKPESWRHEPMVLMAAFTTYGRSTRYYESYLRALSRFDWRIARVASDSGSLAKLGSLPANCHPIQGFRCSCSRRSSGDGGVCKPIPGARNGYSLRTFQCRLRVRRPVRQKNAR